MLLSNKTTGSLPFGIHIGSNTTGASDIQEQARKAYWYLTSVAAISVVSFLGNGMVILLIVSRQRLQCNANWFIFSLSCADFLVGSVVAPSYMAYNFGFETNFNVLILFFNFFFYASVGNLCIMTLDRYVAVTQPLKYVLWMSRNRLALLVTAAWLIPAFISLLPLSWSNHDNKPLAAQLEYIYVLSVVIACEILPCVVMLLVYARLFLIARHHLRQISYQKAVTSATRRKVEKQSGKHVVVRRQERSNLRVFFIVLVIFVICWVLSAYRALCSELAICQGSEILTQVSRLLMFLNSSANVIVYAILKRDIRKELTDILKCNRGNRR